ncbi:MAG: hypothetical protein ACXAB4_05605 [Candidatus Hodarchaeales archaeon]
MVTITKGGMIVFVIFLLVSVPFMLALFIPGTYGTTRFSIFNEGWDGYSEFRQIAEEDLDLDVRTIVSSTSVINRLNSTETNGGIYIIAGPAIRFDPTESFAVGLYILRGGRVVIIDDFGTGNDALSLISTFLQGVSSQAFGMTSTNDETQGAEGNPNDASFPIVGLKFNGSVLCDAGNGRFIDSPVQPIFHPAKSSATRYVVPWIEPFLTEPNDLTASGRNGVVGNFATSVSMKVRYNTTDTDDVDGDGDTSETIQITKWVPMSGFEAMLEVEQLGEYGFNVGVNIGGLYSSSSSWLEANQSDAKDGSMTPSLKEWGNVEFPVFVTIPIPGFTSTTARGESVTLGGGSLTLISDPSIFINKYLDDSGDFSNYDNREFAHNLLYQLTQASTWDFSSESNSTTTDRSKLIIFDEGHLQHDFYSPIFFLGSYLRFLDLMSMFPLFAPILPIMVITAGRRLMPKKRASGLLLTRVEQYYGRSFFSVKMRWFLEYQQYARGLELIYRRFRRQLVRTFQLVHLDLETQCDVLTRELGLDYDDLFDRFIWLENVISARPILSEEEFMDHYLFLKELTDAITGQKGG